MNDEDARYAVIALGSNLGNSAQLIQAAMNAIGRRSGGPVLRSSLWSSSPVDCPPGSPSFFNAVVAIVPEGDETPEGLLRSLQTMESELGRTCKLVPNEPRPIDLDLISFGRQTRDTESLILPHPRATRRKFVLAPLAEILPDYQAPGWTARAAALLEQLESDPGNDQTCECVKEP